jgi:hypothetical protein
LADKADSHQHRRIHDRTTLKVFVWFSVIERPDSLEGLGQESNVDTSWSAPARPIEGLAHSVDLSAQGLGFIASRPLPVGIRVFLEITSSRGNISAVGRIQSCISKGNYFRVGISLEIVPPNDRPVLAALVK